MTATIERHAPAIVDVALHDARTGKTETLTCTPEHPFFVSGQGWVEAGSLGIGTSLVSRAGPALSVTGVTWHRNQSAELAAGSVGSSVGGYVVYNLTVEDDHTFFVGTAGGGTWVHNACPCSLRPDPDATGPHMTYKTDADGNVTKWQEWQPQSNPRNPAPWESPRRYDADGDPHYNKATDQDVYPPHVHDPATP